MLYLLEDREYLKIGYTKDIQKRFKQHRCSNLHFKLLDFKPGTLKNEKELHELCKNYLITSEWFKNCKEVKDIWNCFKSELDLNKLKQVIKKRAQIIENCFINPNNLKTYHKIPHIDKNFIDLLQELRNNQILTEIEHLMCIYNNQEKIFKMINIPNLQINEYRSLYIEYFPNKNVFLNIACIADGLLYYFGDLDKYHISIHIDIFNQNYSWKEYYPLTEQCLIKLLEVFKKESN